MRFIAYLSLLLLVLGEAAPAEAKRLALVIGNSRYDNIGSLANPQRDAGVIADRLRDLGFEVVEAFDANTFAMSRAVDRFLGEAKDAELALFYFAGHGVQLFDQNFLLPREVDPRRVRRVEDLGLSLAGLMERMRASGAIRHLLIVDACRDNPFSFDETIAILDRLKQSRVPGADPRTAGNSSRGLAGVTLTARSSRGQTSATERTTGVGESMLLFAAQPGAVSYDGVGQHSYLVEGLQEGFSKPDRPLSELLRDVSRYVRTVTNGRQVPQLVSDWSGDIVLGRPQGASVEYDVSGDQISAEDRRLMIKSASGFTAFDGDFIGRASIGIREDFSLTEAERKRIETLGLVYRLTITYDLDRDGRDEKLHVDWLQSGYRLVIEVDGVSAAVSNCIPNLAANVEIALRDVNGDRRPEVWVAYADSSGTWGTFCILEYRGLAAVGNWRRGNVEMRNAGYDAFRTLLRAPSGWGVKVGTDHSIKVCAGSNCHTNWSYKFQDGYFALVDSTEWFTAVRALPFRDEAERAANTYAAYLKASRPADAGQWQTSVQRDPTGRAITAEVKANFADGLSVGYECAHNGGMMMYESLFVQKTKEDGPITAALDEVMDYGEVFDRAPVRIGDAVCRHSETLFKDGRDIIYLEEKSAERCAAALDAGGVLTLPVVLNDKSLVQVRLARGSAIAATRAACLKADPRTAALQAASTQPAIATPDLKGRIADFIAKKYLVTTTATGRDLTALYMESVDFHGQAGKPRSAIVKEVGAWLKRWSSLDYRLLPPSVQIKPVPGADGRYDVTFEYTFAAHRQNGTGRCGQGQTELRLVKVGDDFRISRVHDKANGKNC